MKSIFHCVDGHTCGNPVRLVLSNIPELKGSSMAEKRLHFLKEYDWIRKSLMFEPRGHDMMSGSMLFAPHDPDNDVAILYIETSGCLPMCGHGTIGTITFAIEEGLIHPHKDGIVRLETPAGLVIAKYEKEGGKVSQVTIENIPSFLHSQNLEVQCPELGMLNVDVAYGGNFYAIIDSQENFKGIENHSASQLISWSPILRNQLNQNHFFQHPLDKNIQGLSHILWTGKTIDPTASGRNAVFYGDKAIDRSPCGTGTSARMAQWHAKEKLKIGDVFIHESIIGSQFKGEIIEETECGPYKAIIPSISGWAKITGYNQIIVDTDDDPYAKGFQVI